MPARYRRRRPALRRPPNPLGREFATGSRVTGKKGGPEGHPAVAPRGLCAGRNARLALGDRGGQLGGPLPEKAR